MPETIVHFVFSNVKRCIHICSFYFGKTYKFAVTVLIILTNRDNVTKTKDSNAPRLDFGATLTQVGIVLAA